MDRRRTISLSVIFLSVCSLAFAQDEGAPLPPVAGTQATSGLGTLPASFAGDLPSADGPRIRYHLDLFPDQVFVLRLSDRGGEEEPPFDEIGRWALSADAGRLMLQGVGRAPLLFSVHDKETLVLLDQLAREFEPPSSYNLTRLEPFAPVEPRLLLRGMYGMEANAGVFVECLTGWRLPVAEEGDAAALESAYAQTRHQNDEPLFVTLLGRVVRRPRMDSTGTQMALVPERFIGVWPSETCGPRRSTAMAEDTHEKTNPANALPRQGSD